jgi:menaquinone-dependent protoporphyrinogen oxidase
MRVLVTYASRHGSTKGIAERVADRLRDRDLDVALWSVADAPTPDGFNAVVIGAAAYLGRWLPEATTYVERNREALASRPTWLFSSGPVGTDSVDPNGHDLLETSKPLEADELASSIEAREWRVFFGSFDPAAAPIGLAERFGAMFRRIPAVREAMPAGDFRDWPAIEAWADLIADALAAPLEGGAAVATAHG